MEQDVLIQIFREGWGEAFLLPFDSARTLAAMQGFGNLSVAAMAAAAGGLFVACVMNLLLGVIVRRSVEGKIHLPPWRVFSVVTRYGNIAWPAVAALCFLPVFPQLLFFAGLVSARPWRLLPWVVLGCVVSGLVAAV